MKLLKFLPVILILNACMQTTGKTEHKAIKLTTIKFTKQTPDSLLMTKPGVVVIRPSSRMIKKMKKDLPKDGDYDTVLDDNVFYMSESEHYIDSLKTFKVERESEGVMKFKTLKGKIYTVKLDSIFFGIILFNGIDKPLDADMTVVPDEYARYMGRAH